MGQSRYYYVILAAGLLLVGCSGPPKYTSKAYPAPEKPVIQSPRTSGTSPAGSSAVDRQRLKSIYMDLLGARYAYGGQSAQGFDCSGLMRKIFWEYDQVRLPRTVGDMFRYGQPVTGSGLKTGDLVFFNTTGRGASHVGMYLWNDMFLHASSSEGVTLTDMTDGYWSSRFLGARRVLN